MKDLKNGKKIIHKIFLTFQYCNKMTETYTIEIIEPKAKKLLDDLANLNLIKVQESEKPPKKDRKFGSMKGLVKHIADDFDAPLEDFKDYM